MTNLKSKNKRITLGIIGGGQLGRMLVEAACKLNIKTIVLDPTPKSPAGQIADSQIIGDYKDSNKIKLLARKVDFLTYEIESANVKALKELEGQGVKIQPSSNTLEIIQDKFSQKQFLTATRIPVAPFNAIENIADIEKTAKYLGFPLVLKARRHGFDGRGNTLIKDKSEIKRAFNKLKGQDLYIENFVPYKLELAVQIARSINGEIISFPLVETIQKNNICHLVKAPARVNKKINLAAKKLAINVIENLKGAGVFGIEMFLTKDGKVLVNEIAPRVHNSGHYTIEACNISQFEEHVRAVCNLPLKPVNLKTKYAVMINILGNRTGRAIPKGIKNAEKIKNVYVHIYGKSETRPERKMGHITVIGENISTVFLNAQRARSLITI